MDYLYLVRHGETEWNAEGRMQGQLDSPLTARGVAQAEQNGELLAAEGVEHLLVSTMGRTRQTAALINRHAMVDMAYDARLMERHCGAWGGLTIDEISARYAPEWHARLDDPYHHRPPGGENLPDMIRRVAPLLDTLAGLPYRRMALISHGVMARCILAYLLALAPERTVTVRQPNDCVYRIGFNGDRAVAWHCFRAGDGPFTMPTDI